jgi:hypothetical protein
MGNANPLNQNKRENYNGLILMMPNSGLSAGSCGRSSNDLCLVCANNMNFLDVAEVIPGSEEYALISNAGSPGIAIRIV